jgi:hypothetical protein
MDEKERILSEIRRLAEENDGRLLGRNRFFEATGIRESDWLGRYWARRSDAVEEAGLQPNAMQGRTDDREALRRLALETRRFGYLPTYAEMRMQRLKDQRLPSNGVYERLGPKRTLAARLAAFCEEEGDYADVLDIVSPLLDSEEPPTREGEEGIGSVEHGFVYLLRSGRYYKIGHTNSAGRRAYELAIQLPERPTPIHEILVFSGIDDAPFHAASLYRRADRAWEKAGLTERLRLHQARHTYASFMIAAGVNAKALSVFMGHSSIKVTFDLYGHLMPGAEAEAAALLDTFLDGHG